MKQINGIRCERNSDHAVFYIENLTDQLKECLREHLPSICHGESAQESALRMYKYEEVLEDFLLLYKGKTKETQKGLIGELLVHLVLKEYSINFTVASPFFNSEERSIKKGFDIVLFSEEKNCLWITEVKSGEVIQAESATTKTCTLIQKAKSDLYRRLANKNNYLWQNAIKSAKLSLENNRTLKDAVVDILDTNKACKEGGSDINVFLAGVIFAPVTDPVDQNIIEVKTQEIQNERTFKKVFVLSLQKGTYEKVYKFLESEIDVQR